MAVDTIPAELPVVLFSDGSMAKLLEGKAWGKNRAGEPITRLVIRPTDNLIKLNEVKRDELENGIDLILDIPTKTIIDFNPFSPTNKTIFVMTNYRKKPTDLTKFFYCNNCGKDYPNVYDALRAAESTIKSKEIQVANFKEEIKNLSEKLELKLSEETVQRIVDSLYERLSKLLVGRTVQQSG